MELSKRALVSLVAAGTLVLATPAGASPATRHHHVTAYQHAYDQVVAKFGRRAPGRNIERWGYGPHGKRATRAQIATSLAVLRRILSPPPLPAPAPSAAPYAGGGTATAYSAPSPAALPSGGGYGDVPGVPASFAACVATRESSNGAGSSNIYGIIPASGVDVSGMSVDQQKQAFSQMYQAQGSAPWSPYDGC